ncbi:MAG: hypothetical protein U9O59_08015 [Actinomycetota bacterium]|nr:hypothetical protein [Actinomycetota bacterium]
MKKFFLILTAMALLVLVSLAITGCKTAVGLGPELVEFMGSEFEITLPDNWEGGTKEELDSVAEDLEDLGQDELAEDVIENKVYLLFFGYDSEAAAEGGDISNLTITGETAGFLSIEEYMDLTYTDLAEKYKEAEYEFNIIEQDIVSIGNYEEVGRTLTRQEVNGAEVGTAQYIIKNESDFWVLTFTAGQEEFNENIEAFDEVFKTFKIKD